MSETATSEGGGLSFEQGLAALAEMDRPDEGSEASTTSTEADKGLEASEVSEESEAGSSSAEVSESGDEGSEGSEGAEGSEGSKDESANALTDLSALPDTARVKVGDTEVSVSDLKAFKTRLAAQEQAGVELAKQRDQVTEARALFVGGLKRLADEAQRAWTDAGARDHEAAKAEFLRAGDTKGWQEYLNTLNAIYERAEITKAEYLKADAGMKETQQADMTQALTEMSKALMNPATGIPGYDQARHSKNGDFALSLGVSPSFVQNLTDPAAWRIIDMARRYGEGEKALAKVKEAPAAQSAKPALRTKGNNGDAVSSKAHAKEKAMAKLEKTGSLDAGMQALAALGIA